MIKTFLTWLKSLFLQFSFIINCVDYAHLFKFQCFEDSKCWSIFKILWSCRPKNRSHIPKSFYGTTYIYAVKFCFLHRSPNWLHSAVMRFLEDGRTDRPIHLVLEVSCPHLKLVEFSTKRGVRIRIGQFSTKKNNCLKYWKLTKMHFKTNLFFSIFGGSGVISP